MRPVVLSVAGGVEPVVPVADPLPVVEPDGVCWVVDPGAVDGEPGEEGLVALGDEVDGGEPDVCENAG